MKSHSAPNKLQFTAGTTNVNVGGKADIVILLGPDNENDTNIQKQFAELKQYCENNHLKYVLLGDGKNPVTKDDIAKLPQTNYVILNGHGNVSKPDNAEASHVINITGRTDNTLELMHDIQQQTNCNRFVCCACYAGRINEDIKTKGKMNINTEVITTSPPDEVSSIKYNYSTIANLLVNVSRSKHKRAPMSGYFGNLMKACPETMTYGIQLDNGFQTFTVRRQDRAILGEGDPQKYFEYNRKRLNEFLRAHHQAVYKLDKMTDAEALNYRKTTFLHHVWHCDVEAIEKLIRIDPDIMADLPQSPLRFALKNHAVHSLMSKKRDDVKKLFATLIAHDPDGLTAYLENLKLTNPSDAAYHHSIKTILYEIANETQSPHLIRELCGAAQNEINYNMQNLTNAQSQLYMLQLIQDPALLQQRFVHATELFQQAALLTQESFWIYSNIQHLNPTQAETAAQQLHLARTAVQIGQRQLDQAQLDICLQQLHLGMNLTNHGLQQCLAAAQQDDSHMTQTQHEAHLQSLYKQAQSLLQRAQLELEHANHFYATQMEMSRGQQVMPHLAVTLLRDAQSQVTVANGLIGIIIMSLQHNEQERIAQSNQRTPQPTRTEADSEATRLEKLVQLELKSLSVIIENINKSNMNHDTENAARNKTSADKRIKEIMSYLIKLQLLAAPSIDKYNIRLNELREKLKDSQKDNLGHRQGYNK